MSNLRLTYPVQIQYHLPYSSHTFTTILPALQQVYIYPAAPSDKGGNSESWGSIYLKTVVQGVVMARYVPNPRNCRMTSLTLADAKLVVQRSFHSEVMYRIYHSTSLILAKRSCVNRVRHIYVHRALHLLYLDKVRA